MTRSRSKTVGDDMNALKQQADDFVKAWAACTVHKSAPFYQQGGFAGSAFLLAVAQHDPFTEEEYQKTAGSYVATTSSFLLNAGVVAALILSVLFETAMEKLDEADGVSEIWSLAHFISIHICCALSIGVIFVSLRMYIHLTNWMPTLADQMWYLAGQRKALLLMSFAQTTVLLSAGCSLIFAAIANASYYGLIALPSALMLLYLWLVWDNRRCNKACAQRLHLQAKKLHARRGDAEETLPLQSAPSITVQGDGSRV